jgi:2-polyprenyl-3-methyl-5-hydroxy-6-metoxy-1,4-benzoquinol methylase
MGMNYTQLKIKDEAYTQEEFGLMKDQNGVLMTYPKPEELSSYYDFGDYISHQTNQTNWISKIYSLVKNRMFSIKLNTLLGHSQDIKTALDYGCGTGEFVSYLNAKGIQAEGYEPTPSAFENASNRNIKVYNTLDSINQTYDVITLFHVLEHVDDYMETLNELKGRLNPNGILVIAVPNYKSYDATFYKEKWAGWDVPRHLWHFNRKDISNIADEAYLELIKIKPMPFDAYYISMISEGYKGNSKILGLWKGLLSNLKAINSKEYSSNMFLLKKKAIEKL